MFADLSGKIALVTGSGSGIGRATAYKLAEQGAVVVGCDINAETAEDAVAAAPSTGGSFESIHPVDLTRPEEARRVVEEVMTRHGRLDILANVAGFTAPFSPFAETDFERQWRYTLIGELDLVFLVTQAAWPHLIASGGGSVINVASAVAHSGFPGLPALPHITAKGGILSMTRQMAAEGAAHGIRVNSVSPGLIATPQSAPALEAEHRKAAFFSSVLIKRYGRPEDVASCITFLASDESSWVTGVEYLVDGGATAI